MQIFQFVDGFFSSMPAGYRSAVAIFLMLLLLFSIWRLLKGYGIFILIILLLIPGIWPALKTLGHDILYLGAIFLYRI